MSALLALLPLLLALAIGIGIGMLGGGHLTNLVGWRPAAWEVAVGAIAVAVLADAFPWRGVVPFMLSLGSMAALVYVAWMNRRVGGMIVVALGLAMNLVPVLVNGGMPVSADALVSSGAIEEAELPEVELTGPRHLASNDDLARPLGAVVPLPIGLVISPGDIVALLGLVLVTQAVLRRRQVRMGGPAPPTRNPRVSLDTYQEALDTLGQGPADNTYGIAAEHVAAGASGNVRAVPLRPADASVPLETVGPRVEGAARSYGESDDDLGVTVRPIPQDQRTEGAAPGSSRPRRSVLPPHGDIRPAPSGLDVDTGESAIVSTSSLPPRRDRDTTVDPDNAPPPGWAKAADAARRPPASPTPYSGPPAPPDPVESATADPADPTGAVAAVPTTAHPAPPAPTPDSPAPTPRRGPASAPTRPTPPEPGTRSSKAEPVRPAPPEPEERPAEAAPARPAPPKPDARPDKAAPERPAPPEPGTRPGGVRRPSAPAPPPPLPVTAAEPDEDSSATAEHQAVPDPSATQATPAVSPDATIPGRYRVPASARGRRPRRDGTAPQGDDDEPPTGEVPTPPQPGA